MIKKNYPILLVILVLLAVVLFTKTTFLNQKSRRITLPTPTIAPAFEKLPWENSTCGNNVCEICESSDSCCNYPPVKDKNGTLMYPPPTCIGQCPSDCTNEIKSGK